MLTEFCQLSLDIRQNCSWRFNICSCQKDQFLKIHARISWPTYELTGNTGQGSWTHKVCFFLSSTVVQYYMPLLNENWLANCLNSLIIGVTQSRGSSVMMYFFVFANLWSFMSSPNQKRENHSQQKANIYCKNCLCR